VSDRIRPIDSAKEVIRDFHGRKIEIFNGEKWEKYAVKRVIPIHTSRPWSDISDVEVLLNKEKNHYFSIVMFLKDESWVKDVRIGGVNLTARKMDVICPTPKYEEVWIKTVEFIKSFKEKETKCTH
jgi:hypothetical protein